jgi:hypothetical protein
MRTRLTNELYTLTGDFQRFAPETQVVVEGSLAEVSTCMQGTVLEVQRITRR